MIILLNGAFGIGKTTVARSLAARLPRAVVFDPERIGVILHRVARLTGRRVDDFQDLPSWRRLTIAGLRATRAFWPNIVVPMAFSNLAYLQEIRAGVSRFEPQVLHFCLVAPVEVVHARLRDRGESPTESAWQYRRASECCLVHRSEAFATHIATVERSPDQIAKEVMQALAGELVSP